jgi:hypothetical protein
MRNAKLAAGSPVLVSRTWVEIATTYGYEKQDRVRALDDVKSGISVHMRSNQIQLQRFRFEQASRCLAANDAKSTERAEEKSVIPVWNDTDN